MIKTIKNSELEKVKEKMHKIHARSSSKLIKACLIRSHNHLNSKQKTLLLAELFDALKEISELSDQE